MSEEKFNLTEKISHIRLKCGNREEIIIPDKSTELLFKEDELILNQQVIIELPKKLRHILIANSDSGKKIIFFKRRK